MFMDHWSAHAHEAELLLEGIDAGDRDENLQALVAIGHALLALVGTTEAAREAQRFRRA